MQASHAPPTSAAGGRCCPGLQPRPRVTSQRCTRAHARHSQDMTIAVQSNDASASVPCSDRTCAVPLIASAAALIGAAYWFKVQGEQRRGTNQRKVPEPWPELALKDSDPHAYQMALSRTRQAQHVTKATSLMKAGEPTRAMVELKRALDENELCRSPLLDGHQTHDELVGLYKLHLKYTEMPPSFPLLLQLRELLGISGAEAERVEAEVLQAGCCFSI